MQTGEVHQAIKLALKRQLGTGLRQPNKQTDLIIYPNPAKETCFIQLEGERQRSRGIWSLYNINGQLVKEGVWGEGQHNHKLDLLGLSKGIYWFVLKRRDKTQVIQRKLLIR